MKIPALILLALLGFAHFLQAHEGDVVKVGDRAPLFTGTGSDGKSVSLDSFKGKLVLVDFFATWCPDCLVEMPHLESEVWEKFRDQGLVVLAVGREHSVAEMAQFKSTKKLTFTFLADPKREIYSKYAKEYIPRCYLIGKSGVIRFASTGYEVPDFASMKARIAMELEANGKP